MVVIEERLLELYNKYTYDDYDVTLDIYERCYNPMGYSDPHTIIQLGWRDKDYDNVSCSNNGKRRCGYYILM
jgi:hypothetical protein